MNSEFNMVPAQIAKRLTDEERLKRVGFPEGMTVRQATAITNARLQYALSELADMKVEQVSTWLDEVGRVAPAEAIRLFMELLEFRMPRMKAAQVNLNATVGDAAKSGKDLKSMSIEELNRVVAEG
jgi:hypothetical protein